MWTDANHSIEYIPEFLQQTLGQTETLEADRLEWYCHREPAQQYLAWACPCLQLTDPWHPSC
jgi:hypothetical protein